MRVKAWLAFCIAGVVSLAGTPISAISGTTGGVSGRVVDSSTQAPLANVNVTITSPSESTSTATDANGTYHFLSLAPDTYTLTFTKDAYTPVSDPGLSIFADQVQTVNIAMTQALKTIANVRSRAGTDIVKAGTTSDVYSVNAAGQNAAQNLVGTGGLNNAYGAIASVPGVNIDPGEQGWFQTVHIRGGDIDQVGYELDGIPVNRVYDNAPQTMLSSLGQQELQVYTGGTPATADAQGIAGYINQVVKTGTYPGFGTIDLGIGTPTYYHKASFEAGGSTPNRLFSYYVGLAGADQSYRYIDNNNGGSPGNMNWFFYPVNAVPGLNGFVYTGDPSFFGGAVPVIDPAFSFTTGSAYGLAYTSQRDNVVNLHFGIPHKHGGLRDDVQLMYLTSEVAAQYYSNANDLGPNIDSYLFQSPLTWDDAYLYKGSMLAPLNASQLTPYFFNSSPTNRAFGSPLPFTQRDTNDNGVAITKLQYQHSFSSNAFVRLYGYTLYSNWFIYGPNSAAQPLYGAELADYEIPNHTYGVNLSFTDQLSPQHLLTASGVYTATDLQRYSAGFFSGGTSRPVALLLNGTSPTSGCVSVTGTPEGCYAAIANGDVLGGSKIASGNIPPPPAGTQWVAVDRGLKANLNQVHPRFSGFSLTDQWRPSDRWTINSGVRIENFKYLLGDTSPNDPARQFWFAHYNAEFCFGPGDTAPVMRTMNGLGPCPSSTESAVNLVNTSSGQISTTRWQPRFGFTYSVNPETVIRGSAGVYARPQNTSWVQYNTTQEDLASFIGSHFYSYGFHTPEHDIRPDTSYNYDISLEKRLHATDWSFKLTPFYRSTRDQLQNFFIDPLTGLESGLNVGHQVSYGVEFALRKGNFDAQGLSGQVSYTYTHSRIQYQNFPNTNRNVIDNLNSSISQYNAYTSACASGTRDARCGTTATGVAAAPCYTVAPSGIGAPTAYSPGTTSCPGGTLMNPYWTSPIQNLFDRNGYYTTYDVIPGPVSAENGYETPHVATLILNYRRGKWAFTPSVNYNSGASYGGPLSWPGYMPETCSKALTGTAADPASCNDNVQSLPLFMPDKYTGHFDNLGEFKQPWRISLNMNISYNISNNVSADVLLTNIVDHCGQRGYAWDNSNVCVYSSLPTGILYPAGNFFPNSFLSAAPPQLQFPYSFWLNNNNTGFVGVKLPFTAVFNLHVKI